MMKKIHSSIIVEVEHDVSYPLTEMEIVKSLENKWIYHPSYPEYLVGLVVFADPLRSQLCVRFPLAGVTYIQYSTKIKVMP